MPDSLFTPTEVTADLRLLEKLMHQLGVDYELFFAARADGKINVLPPHRRLQEVEAIVRHYTKHVPHRTVDRFRFNTLVHRYRINSDRWRRRMKTLEELGASRTAQAAANEHVEDLSKPQVLLATRLSAGRVASAQVRDIYLAYRTARKARGLPVAGLSYTTFADKLSHQLDQARHRSPDADLELRVDEVGGKVRVAVRSVGIKTEAHDASAVTGSDAGSGD